MSRINRPDTLLTELRDLKRRLRLLEAARMRPLASPTAAGREPAPPGPLPASTAVHVPMLPARTQDWPQTDSAEWERLAVTWLGPGGQAVGLTVHVSADAGTAGAVRVTAGGEPVGEPLPVTSAGERHVLTITATRDELEIAVDARRTSGHGAVRLTATVRLLD